MFKTIKTEVFDTTTIKKGDIYHVVDTMSCDGRIMYVKEVTQAEITLQGLKNDKVLKISIENKSRYAVEKMSLISSKKQVDVHIDKNSIDLRKLVKPIVSSVKFDGAENEKEIQEFLTHLFEGNVKIIDGSKLGLQKEK